MSKRKSESKTRVAPRERIHRQRLSGSRAAVQWMLAGLFLLWPLRGAAPAATFTVTNTNSSGSGSLAQAITSANATVAADIIQFNIFSLQGATITGTLPPITQPVTLDGYTMLFASENTRTDTTNNASILVELSGSSLSAGGTILDIQASNTIVRGIAFRNIPLNGIGIRVGAGKTDVAILGNYIGTDATGIEKRSSGTGIRVDGSAIIGTFDAADRNLITANSLAGIELRGPGSTVDNNVMGLDADGLPGLGNQYAILLGAGATNNLIGEVKGNTIAGNDEGGIRATEDAGEGNRFARNDIYNNTGLGIDLGVEGPDVNDEGDADEGPNGLVNSPELNFVRYSGGSLHFRGTLHSKPGQYRVLIYSNTTPDPSGFGEGEDFSGGTILTIEPGQTTRTWAFTNTPVTYSGPVWFSATTEEVATGNTSEFSRATEAVNGGSEYVVTNTDYFTYGSLGVGLSLATEGNEPNTIVFNIPGPGPHTIVAPPGYTINGGGTTIIDGYSQPGSKVNTLTEGSNAELKIQVLAGEESALAVFNILGGSRTILQGLAIHSADGHGIRIVDSDDVALLGNFIGTDLTGTQALGNGGNGISIDGSEDVVIGGALPAYRNILSSNVHGAVADFGEGTRIAGNLIGLSKNLQPLGNGQRGIWSGGDGTVVGGDEPGLGNRIAHNAGPGVEIVGSGASVSVQGNSITANAELGIDLGVAGITPNDADDVDLGANALQNFPVLTSVEDIDADSFVLKGTLDVNPSVLDKRYTIRAYASTHCDASGSGEGERFLDAAVATIDNNVQTFSRTFHAALAPGEFVTATASDSFGRTSEFSTCFEIPGGTLCGDASGNGDLAAGDALLVLKTAVGTESCELCACDVNDSGGITSSDALLVLKSAVGQSITLTCPGC
jgi:hypothetical protein